MYRIELDALDQLIVALRRRGYGVVGPTVKDGVIVYDEIGSVADLPRGMTDDQAPGHYSLEKRADDSLFGYAVGPHSWKKFLFPPHTRLFSAARQESGFSVSDRSPWNGAGPPRYALIGVRACELAAIRIQDIVFGGGEYADPVYRAIRENAFLVAVNCLHPAGNCFCASMGTGPGAKEGFDLSLTEVCGPDVHYLLVESGSARGTAVLNEVPYRKAAKEEAGLAERLVQEAAQRMGKELDAANVREALSANFDHPEWEAVAKRCLSCANCTMVCPTCFCSTVEDTTDLTGDHAERWRRWDSCFTLDFARVAGGSFRSSSRARYRQWLTHKFGSWHDQFGTSGCVGCGRCVTWCPVGIDVTEEVHRIKQSLPEELEHAY